MDICTLDALSAEVAPAAFSLLKRHLDNWHEVRGLGRFPYLIELFTKSDPPTQRSLVVIDIERESCQPTRLVGTWFVEFFGVDPTGADFLQSATKEVRGIFLETHRRLAQEPIGKFHISVCSTSSGRELQVYGLALPYLRKGDLPCAAWLLVPDTTMNFGECGSQVRAVTKQSWIKMSED